MATAASPKEKFSCSVCLDLFTEPATIPCGHSFCLDCIGSYWDQSDQTGVYSCPQCRETFTPRPVLRKNNVIIELKQELLTGGGRTRARDPPALKHSADPAVQNRSRYQTYVVMFRLRHLPSLTPTPVHATVFQNLVLKRHALVQPLRDFEQNLCKQHQRLLELYCRTDQSCICALCIDSDHSDHSIVSSAKGRVEKKLSAHKERAESEQVLSELIRSIERIRTEVGELIGAKEKAAVSRANEQREQLEQEIQELRKRKAEMEQLSETEDHIHFLQSFQSVCAPPTAQQLFDNIDDSFWTLREAVSRLKDHLEGFWKVELMKATIAVDVTLDHDTAHSYLILSEDGKQVRCGDKPQPLPDNPKRFDKKSYVLGREGFTSGRHYWEVEVGEKIRWVLGVTRESSQRKGGITEKPQQGFWVIWWNEENNLFSAVRAPRTPFPLSPKPRKMGVYLDYEGGLLSFYNVETRSHIYTFTDTFTEKLYPLFSPGLYSSGKNAAPLIICPHTYTD
ncbi:UNVERIFIED_CONTAM: hypothetical protein FKN15_044488 [Acipenser sinensis]